MFRFAASLGKADDEKDDGELQEDFEGIDEGLGKFHEVGSFEAILDAVL